MSHANACLTPAGRLRLAQLIVDDGWPLRRAAERWNCSVTTARRWAERYRIHGRAGMADRSSRPKASPRQTPTRTERRVIGLRVTRRWGPARIAYRLRMQPSTVHKILRRYGCPPLVWTDPATGVRIKWARKKVHHYVHEAPGDLVHVDIKKLGRIPDGGGWRIHGRQQGNKNRGTTKPGYWYIHNAIDDHSRLGYSELLTDEKKETAAEFWIRANAYFNSAGITVKRVLTDNGSCYRSKLFAATLGKNTAHRPTARSSGSTAPWSRNGPTPDPTDQRPNAPPASTSGSTPTITTAATPHSRASHQPTSYPTCVDRTPSRNRALSDPVLLSAINEASASAGNCPSSSARATSRPVSGSWSCTRVVTDATVVARY